MGQISPETLNEIRMRTDLVALIEEYVTLRRVGVNMRGLCPFHGEKTPSFYVHPERNRFHCFGCQMSGDAITFLREIEGCEFIEAVQRLAERAGIEVHEEQGQARNSRRSQTQRQALLAIHTLAQRFFLAQCQRHRHGHLALEAYRNRGISDELATRFGLGYAPAEWDGLTRYLQTQRASLRAAEHAGLIAARKSGAGHYDRFRHRLMFPIRTTRGEVIAFSGRILPAIENTKESAEGQAPPKYINSPEHGLYKKGEVLFGLDQARLSMRKQEQVLLCEGNFDVLALHQAQLSYAVAPLGTALGTAQAKLLQRLVPNVTLILDGDAAGEKATESACHILLEEGLKVAIVRLPPGDDPDSVAQREGADALRQRVARALPALDDVIESKLRQVGSDAHAKGLAIRALRPFVQRLRDPMTRQMYIERIAQRFDIRDIRTLQKELLTRELASRRVNQDGAALHSTTTHDFHESLEHAMVGLVLEHPSLINLPDLDSLGDLLSLKPLVDIVNHLRSQASHADADSAPLLAAVQDDAHKAWLAGRLVKQEHALDDARERLVHGMTQLRKRSVEARLRSLQQRILQARREGDADRANALMRQRMDLYRSMATAPNP